MAAPTYDTGLARPQRTLLRHAIAARLAPLLVANGGYVRGIRAIPRPLKGDSEDEIGLIGMIFKGQAPFIGIALGNMKTESTGMDIPPTHARGRLVVTVYVASSSARNYIDGRLETDVVAAADASKDPGIDAMLEHVEELLSGQSYVLGTEPDVSTTSELDLEEADEVATLADLTIWAWTGHIYLEREINPDRLIQQLMLDMYGKHSIAGEDPDNPVTQTDATLEA